MRVILASASPRRRELLAQIGIKFEVRVSDVEEKVTAVEPGEIVESLSRQKAQAVWEAGDWSRDSDLLIIGADTVVELDGRILGKPADGSEAKAMLELLSGRTHHVYTGVTLVVKRAGKEPEFHTFHDKTGVEFYPMSGKERESYVATGEPLDKAGSYGIQGMCARYIRGIVGDYFNVVGLPVGKLYQELRKLGIETEGEGIRV